MKVFNKALLPVDGSEQAARAVKKAAELAAAGVIENLVLFNVYGTSDVDITKLHNQDKLDQLRAESQELLKKYEAVLQAVGVSCKLKRAGGDPAALILDLIESEDDYDLIIMGSRKLNRFQELVLGSVSDKVTRLVSIPVLIIK